VADGVERQIAEAWKEERATCAEEQPENYRTNAQYDVKTPYYGYQHVDMVTGHGDRCGGHYQQWLRETCPNWQELSNPANELPHNYSCPQAYRTPIPEETYPTTWIADRAIDYVTTQARQADPYFAFVSFPDPHHPFNPPGRYWDMYNPDQFDVDLPYEAHQNPTPPMQYLSARWQEGLGPERPQSAFRADSQHIREAMALTAGMVTMIDEQIGRVIEALETSGQLDNTVIIFTSDHGEYLGDFSLLFKGALPFRAATQVPMVWSDPDRAGNRYTDAMCSTIDIPATILDRAGLAPYNGMQGRSFLNCLATDAPHRVELFMEYNDSGSRLGMVPPARMRMLRSKEWRFTTYGGHDWGELYDLSKDPRETNNLWGDPACAETKAWLSLRLIDHLTAQMDDSPLSDRLA
jgi:arylsulfatase A-like enzyme